MLGFLIVINQFLFLILQKEQTKEMPAFIKPPMKDKEIWTHEPEYERYLHIRVFKPENLDARELKCALTFDKQFHKTDVLDPVMEVRFCY